jgi:hypothetical protein
VAGCCEHCNDTIIVIKMAECFQKTKDYHVVKEGCAPWNEEGVYKFYLYP